MHPVKFVSSSFTESLAELAWRYGENCLPFRKIGGTCFFIDGSCMGHYSVDSARGIRHVLDRLFEKNEGGFL